MKLATALSERADIQRRISQLQTRLNNNAKVQEGEEPAEDPRALLKELDALLNRLQKLMTQINLTNSRTVSGGQTLTELIARRDCLTKRVGIMRSFLDNASARADRYSQKEIKVLSTVHVATLQKQVDEAGVYDVYVLWASTNDYVNSRECGEWTDYTAYDNYDARKLTTQCGGINYCIKKLLEKNPDAEIYFFTSLRFFGADAGHNPYSAAPNKTGKTFADYIEAQKACCAYYGIPVLDQFNLQGINEFNVDLYYLGDKLHMNEDGYRRLGPVQASFLADGR